MQGDRANHRAARRRKRLAATRARSRQRDVGASLRSSIQSRAGPQSEDVRPARRQCATARARRCPLRVSADADRSIRRFHRLRALEGRRCSPRGIARTGRCRRRRFGRRADRSVLPGRRSRRSRRSGTPSPQRDPLPRRVRSRCRSTERRRFAACPSASRARAIRRTG